MAYLDLDPSLLSETEEQRELRVVLRKFFATRSGPDMWARMAGELGVQGLAIPEEYGGAGYTFAELAVVLEEAGRALCAAPLLSTVVLAGHALLDAADAEARARYLPGIADGSTTATVAGLRGGVTAERSSDGWLLRGAADFVLDGVDADLLLVVADERLFTCEPANCTRIPLSVLDETRRQARIEFHGAPAIPIGDAQPVSTKVLDIGRAAVAVEQVGGSGHALDATVAYVKGRNQFGRPVGSFQAVKHRLADLLVQVEAARSAASYAVACVTTGSAELPVAAAAAAATCSDTYRLATAEYVQLHGGIGFTWEHTAHLYLRRARSTEVLFGTPAEHRSRLAELLGLAS